MPSSYENVATAESEDWSTRALASCAARPREIGAQMLEVVVWGYEDDAEAMKRCSRAWSGHSIQLTNPHTGKTF